MTLRTKASVKSNLETGDKPTQAEFADWVDSTVFIPATGATGFIEVEGTASATARSVGSFGVVMVAADSTASAQAHLGITSVGAVGSEILSATTTASALNQLALGTPGTVGLQLLEDATTAAALATLNLAPGAQGLEQIKAATTAAALAQLALGSPGAAGLDLLSSTTTAAALDKLALGSPSAVGLQILQAANTAAVDTITDVAGAASAAVTAGDKGDVGITILRADTTASALAELGDPGGAMVLVTAVEVTTTVQSLQLLNVFTSAYERHVVMFENMNVNTDDVELHVHIQTSAGFTSAASFGRVAIGWKADGQLIAAHNPNDNSAEIVLNSPAASAGVFKNLPLYSTLTVYQSTSAGLQDDFGIHFDTKTVWKNTAHTLLFQELQFDEDTSVNGFNVSPNSGNLEAGSVRVYGYVKS